MINAKKVSLLLGDALLLYVSLWLTLILRHWSQYSPQIFQEHLAPFSIVFAIWLVVFFINNLYSVQLTRNDFKFYGYLIQNQIINTIIALIFFYLVPDKFTPINPQTVLIILVLIYTLLFLLWRRFFYWLTSNSRLRANILLIGLEKDAINLIREIEKKPQLGYQVKLIINLDNLELPPDLNQIEQLKDLINLGQQIQTHKINTVVTTTNPKYSAQISRYLFDTINLKLQYYNLPEFYEKITGKVPVASLEKTWFLENLTEGRKKAYGAFKRLEDILVALLIGLLTLPLTICLVLLIKLTSPGPVLYKQVRTGLGGRTFTALKLRSMRQNAETAGQAVWAQKNDSRVTSLGRVMRKLRFDELPQIFNILKGEMSFVGPRPERPEFIKILAQQIPFYNERLLVKPGLTGWAQINYKYGDSIEDALEKLQYDLYYIKNRSFTLDVSIILKTVNAVLNRSLAH